MRSYFSLNNNNNCRESAGAGLIALKSVPVTGAVFSGLTMNQFVRLSFPTPTIGTMEICDTESVCLSIEMMIGKK